MLFLILGILFFAGVGALTAASRCTYAFARDGAIPGPRLWARVDKRLDIRYEAWYCELLSIAYLAASISHRQVPSTLSQELPQSASRYLMGSDLCFSD